VIADDVPSRRQFAEQIRTLARESADDEECSAGIIAREQSEKLRGNRRIRPIVESERKVALGRGAADCGPKELRPWVSSRVDDATSRDQTKRNRCEQRIHRGKSNSNLSPAALLG